MANVARYNAWIARELAPYAGQRVLEVGCGIGNMSDYFLERELLVCMDMMPTHVELLRQRYRRHPNVVTCVGDITDPTTVTGLRAYRFDTVLCLNVLEHIADDGAALAHMYDLLQPDGRLLLFVPAGTYLFGTLDLALGHYRRYERHTLAPLVQKAGFVIERLGYLNLAGILGWWLNSRMLGRHLLPEGQLRLFNGLAPLFIAAERLIRSVWDVPLGQSLLCVARRPSHPDSAS
ncbi:MAG: methyltransferase domain-containing protein [Anaerolineae bacterium]|nr:methyltransferase domain-containing protein [Caldilineales bacterium]MDW8268841.1 methyltransferase domain-containing protein [Anaerolineae bacterium]